MGKKFGDINPSSDDRLRLDEAIDLLPFPKKKWTQVRFLDVDILPVKQHWISIITSKQKKEVNIPKFCVSFDPSTEENIDGVTCPYCEAGSASIKDQKFYLANAIIRDIQDDEPAKKSPFTSAEKDSGFKEMDSNSWTPVRVLRLPMSLAKKIKDLGSLNKVKTKSGEVIYYDVSHPSFGADVNIKFDPDEQGASMYAVQLASRSKLTPEEKAYLIYDLSDEILDKCGRETFAEAQKELDRMQLNDPVDEEEEEAPRAKSKSKSKEEPPAKAGKVKPKTHQVVEEDDEDESDYDLEEDEESVSYEDDSSEDEDEDEDEPAPKAPAKKGKAAPPAKTKTARSTRKPVDEDDDDIPF